MKKIYSFVLMAVALLIGTNAWATTRTAGTYAELQDAITASVAGDVIELTADIAYPASPTRTDLINIDKSITLDGKGHKITGYGYCNYRLDDKETYQATHLAINAKHDKSGLNVTIKNLKLDKNVKKGILNGVGDKAVSGASSSDRYYGIGVFDGVTRLTLEKDTFTTSAAGNAQIICATGTSSSPLKLVMNQVYIDATIGAGYATYFLKPIDLEMNDCYLKGFCALYFKPNLEPFGVENGPRKYWYGIDNYGSKGSVAVLNNCTLDSKNPHSTQSNGFGVLAMEEGDISITLNNCNLDAQSLGSSSQALFLLSDWAPLVNRASNNVLTLTGDNTHINGNLVNANWYALVVDEGENDLYENGYNEGTKTKQCEPFSAFSGDIQVIMTGGTYNFDPRTYQYNMHVSTADPHYADGAGKPTVFTKKDIIIPAGYTVEELNQDNVTLYRVIADIQTSYNINQDVETQGAGENPNTSFIVQETTELVNNATEANYVQVKDNGGVQTTLTIGTATNDQTLTVNSGMDVQDNAQVIIKSGSALVVENGGIISAQPSNIIVEADENGAASLLLAPTVTVNQQPNVTVKMTAKQVGYLTNAASGKDYYWHRFALPVAKQETAWEKSPNRPTWLYGWDYENNAWKELDNVSDMVPFYGYTLSPEHEGREDVTYTFTGKLAGNANGQLQFSRQGYNFFGNSYTGYMNIVALLDQLIGDAKIDATVWMWHNQNYIAVPLKQLQENPESFYPYEKEVAPMQTFILRLLTEELTSTELNYEEAIWNNPRYGNASTPNSAPARRAQNEGSFMRISISNENGESDVVRFSENAKFSDSYDKGYDATKFMNDNMVNMYATIDGEDLSAIATDNIEGKSLTIQTSNVVNYTLSCDIVNGEEYAIRDNVTGAVIAIEEGATYEFAAQPNSVIEGRFEIITRANVPTAIENTNVKANVKGIYTIMGQYLGEDFNALPAGVYVVDGVKIVK